jgi:complement component 1 Q subcomponent-binding protein, mitochondrial
MLSIRTFARSAPRTASRLASSSLRQSAVRSSAFTYRAAAAAPLRTNAFFSTTSARRVAETDGELSAKIDSEIQIEEDMKSNEQQPASVKDFLANSPFELIDTPGQEVVKLVRNFGEEK